MNRRNVIDIKDKRSKLFSSIVTVMLLLSSFFIILVVTTPVVLADVSSVNTTINQTTAGFENATYNITFVVGGSGNLTENVDWINITFQADTSVNQTAMVNGTVSNGTSEVYIDNFTMLNNNLTLNITVPVNISDNGQVWINLTKGTMNPTVAGAYNLSINTSKEPVPVLCSGYTITAASVDSLSVLDQPSNASAGIAIAPSIVVKALDAFNNNVSGVDVYVVLHNGSGSLSGTTMQTTDGFGNATFNDLSIDLAGTDKTLQFNVSAVIVNSSVFSITNASADHMDILVEPSDTTAGDVIGPVVVEVVDAFDNPIISVNVSVVLNNNSFASGTEWNITNATGIAVFSDLVITTVGNGYNLTFNLTGIGNQTSVDFNITSASADSMSIVLQPSDVLVGAPVSAAVFVNDSFGNAVVGTNVSVALNKYVFASGTTWNVTNVSGVAVFDDLIITFANTSYNLTFNLSGVLNVTSDDFNVISPSIKALKWDGNSTVHDTIVYYHYYNNGNNIQFLVENVSSSGVDNVTADFSAFGLSNFVKAVKNGTTWTFNVTWDDDGNGTDVDSGVHIINVSMNLTIGGPQHIDVFVLVNINPLDLGIGLGGATTNWSSVSNTTDFTNITDLVFEIENLGKLTLEGPINLCNQTTAEALAELGSYLTIAQATMSLNTTALAAFNCNSSLMMYYLDFQELPSIYYIPDVGEPQLVVNAGDLVTGQTKITDEINWDETNLTFNVSGWSQYQAFDSAPTVTVNPSTVGVENATYCITFSVNNTGNLTEDIHWINITFPNGTSVNQTAMVNGTVSNGTSELYIDSFTMLNNNLTLNITVPVNISDNGQVWINITKGIKNPIIPGLYNISINTSKQISSVISTDYSIVPDAPTGFTATAVSTNQINLAWTKGANATHTRIQRKTGSYPTTISDGTNVYNGTGTSYSNTGLSASTTYYYSAWSWNSTSNLWSSTYVSAQATTQSSGGGTSPPVPPPSNLAPIADAGGPYTGYVNHTITFNASASTDDVEVTGYRWDWTNDGTYDTGWLAIPTATHTYTTEGVYTVKLEVKDLQGQTSTDTATVTITSPSGQNPPVADAGGPYAGLTFEDIIFDGSKSYDSDGSIVNYTWDFGDGNIKYGQKPVQSYNTQGLYNITLTVTDNDGLTDSDTTTINIILDSDGDGVSDEKELEIGSDPFKNDIVFIEIQGKTYYLIDTENGIPNRFYDSTMGKDILFKALDDGTILLDINQDGTWDYIYNPASGAITSYKEDKPSDEMPWLLILISIIIAIIIIIAVLFMLGIIYIERE